MGNDLFDVWKRIRTFYINFMKVGIGYERRLLHIVKFRKTRNLIANLYIDFQFDGQTS